MSLLGFTKRVIPFLLTGAVFVFLYFLTRSIPEKDVRLLLESVGIWAPIFFVFLVFITNVVAPISGSPLLFAGFYAFGINVVFLFVVAGLASSMVAFWIARLWGRSIVKKFVSKENMGKIDKFTHRWGLLTLFLLRVFQPGVFDYVSYAAGISPIGFIPYLIVSSLGIVPGTLAWYFLSLYADTPVEFTGLSIVLATVLSAVFVLGMVVKYFLSKFI